MKLSKLFDGLPDIEITGMELDSRKIKKGDLFFAVTGNLKKGSEFIPDTIKNGAIAIIGDEDLNNLPIPYFKIDELRKNMALIASRFYTSKPKNIIAITGTNGKTSIASFVSQIFNILGYNAASIGTMGVISKDLAYDFGTTTPSIIELNQILESFSKNQVDTVIFEASSHGIDQNRIDYIPLQTAGFTNLSQDHLDYHITIENYKNAKKRLFSEILSSDKIAVINADDEEFDFFANCGKKYGAMEKKVKI